MEVTEKKDQFQRSDRGENHSGGFKRVRENRRRGFVESGVTELFLRRFSIKGSSEIGK